MSRRGMAIGRPVGQRLSLVLLLVAAALALTACGPETLVVGLEPTPTPDLRSHDIDTYGFSFRYPETWTLTEEPHMVQLSQGTVMLNIAYGWASRPGFSPLGGRTGIPAGDRKYSDKVTFMEGVVPAEILEYEGKDKMVLYGGTSLVEAGDLVFSIWLEDTGGTTYEELDIPKVVQAEAKGILASFERIPGVSEPPTPTAMPAATAAPSTPSDPAAGLMYSTAETLWGIDVDGSPVALIDEPSARVSSDGARAVFATSLSDPWASDIWLVDFETGTRSNVTNTPDRDEVGPRWWPGRSDVIAFGSDEHMEIPGGGYPTVVHVDGTGYEVLDDEEGGPLGLSPDGALAAYGGYDDLGRIYRWGGEPELFDPSSYGVSVDKLYVPAWHPDGRHLAWEVGGDLSGEGTWQMGVVLFDLQSRTSQLLHVYEPTGGSFPHTLAWSPDGEWLAFVTHQEPPSSGRLPNLWVVQPRDEREVYVGAGVDPVWSPDGKWLAFTEVQEDGNALAVAEVDSWQVEQLDLPHGIESVSGWIAPRSLTELVGAEGSTAARDGEPTSPPDMRTYENTTYGFSFEYPASWTVEEVAGERVEDDVKLADSVVLRRDKFAIVVQYQRKSDLGGVAWGGDLVPGGTGYAEAILGERVTLLGEETYTYEWRVDGDLKAVEVNTHGEKTDLVLSIALADSTARLIQDDDAASIPDFAMAALDQVISSFAVSD